MVTLEQLEALDLVLWLRSGAVAASYCLCDQSSVSRRLEATLRAFQLRLRRGPEYVLSGDATLLRLERIVHQQARFLGFRPLRLEATHYIRDQLIAPPINDWVLGPCHHRGIATLLGLLEERIIDAWISSDIPDLPEADDPRFTVIPLWQWPGELVVHPFHPLVGERGLTRGDLERFPSLLLPEALYPALARLVHAKGFGHPRQLNRYDLGSWDGLTSDATTISYGSCLTLAVDPNLRRLDWNLGLVGGEALVVLREWGQTARIALLLEDLRQRQQILQRRLPQLVGQL